MTNQEAFDTVLEKLLAQGEPGHERGFCKMITSDGRRCALGHLVLEDVGATQALHLLQNRGLSHGFPGDLLCAHDDSARMSNGNAVEWRRIWLEKMRSIATCWGLDASKVPNV